MFSENERQGKNLRELVAALSDHLLGLGYRPTTIAHLNVDWRKLTEYADAHGTGVFSMELGRSFVWDCFGSILGDKDTAHTINRSIHMLADFERYGMVFKQSSITLKGFSPEYKELFESFLSNLRETGTAASSIPTWKSRLFCFEYFLLNNGVTQFSQIERQHILTYAESLSCFSSSTVGATIRILRKLFDFAIAYGSHQVNFIDSLPDVRRTRRYRLPNIFAPDDVDRMLTAVDRSNALGKRDYAILLIVAKLGLRISDVRGLRFDNIDWQEKRISIIQRKTGVPLDLPLFDDIGWAIIDYLQHGRPQTECSHIFVKHLAPYDELSGCLQHTVLKYVQKAGIHTPANKPIGMHTFRHSLATTLLKNGATYTEIAQVLGHATPESAQTYISLDVEQLRQCALEVLF